MQVSLNPEKGSFYFVEGVVSLTVVDPGPVEVDVDKLTQEQAKSFFYGCKFQQIKAEEPMAFYRRMTGEDRPFREEPQQPVPQSQVTVEEVTKKSKVTEEKIKSLLSKSVASVKKGLPELSFSELKVAVRLESSGKNRKTVAKLLEDLLSKKTQEVLDDIENTEPDTTGNQAPNNIIRGGLSFNSYLENVSEVVESESEEVIINPVEKK